MDTIHFRIDEETKRHKTDLTKLMRQKAEELAEEEREYQKNAHAYWLEKETENAINNNESDKATFIEHDESQKRMAQLRKKLCGDDK